jgi:flagellar motor switch protein FliG
MGDKYNINDLKLADDKWIHARVIDENEKIILKKLPLFNIIAKLDDRAIQKVLQEVDKTVLAQAIVNVDSEIQEKIFRNMSQRAVKMLKENMELLKKK